MIELIRNLFEQGEVIGHIDELPSEEFWMECKYRMYITLFWNNQFVFCLDNADMDMEEIIEKIEKRTRMKFADIPIHGDKDDFQGLRFKTSGWPGDFWKKVRRG